MKRWALLEHTIRYLGLVLTSGATHHANQWMFDVRPQEWWEYLFWPLACVALWAWWDYRRGYKAGEIFESFAQPKFPAAVKAVTISDVIEYHEDKDKCDMCQAREWACPRHPFNPHNERPLVSVVFDTPYYIARFFDWYEAVQVDESGRARSGRKAERYALVLAGDVREAKAKFERGEVEKWLD